MKRALPPEETAPGRKEEKGGATGRPPPPISLGPGGEFDLIRRLMGPEGPLPPGVRVGPGDDCAVLETGMVLSVDLTVEGVHFRRSWISLEEAGYRAAAGALSDLAAMAANPLGILLSLALGPEEGPAEAQALQDGAREACRREGIQVLGGDLSRSPGPVVVDVVALGRTESPILRAGAQVGDEIWVTGWLGGSGGAVRSWEEGGEPPDVLREAFVRPHPRIREARWLNHRAGLKALIDLSDGLAGDAGHLAAASGVSIVLSGDAIPLHPGLAHLPDPGDGVLDLALTAGEDYELCLASAPGVMEQWVSPFREEFGLPLTRVGWVREGEGVFLESADGEQQPLGRGGFSHFSVEDED